MIVRDEIAMLPACLDSLAGAVDQTVIVDTGSTDGTDEWAASRADVFVRFPWCDDFSAARNAGLERASGDWILIVDADERLTAGAQALREACDTDALAWRIEVRDGSGSVWLTRLFRRRDDVRFRGRIHEQVTEDLDALGAQVHRLQSVCLDHLGYDPEIFAARGKRQRNVGLLRRELEDRPNDPYLYYKLHQALGGDPSALERAGELTLAMDTESLRAFAIGDELLCAVAGQWLSVGRLAMAERACIRAIEAFGEHPALLTHLGTARAQLGKTDSALRAFSRGWKVRLDTGRFAVDLRSMRIHLAREYAKTLVAKGERSSAARVIRELERDLTTRHAAHAV